MFWKRKDTPTEDLSEKMNQVMHQLIEQMTLDEPAEIRPHLLAMVENSGLGAANTEGMTMAFKAASEISIEYARTFLVALDDYIKGGEPLSTQKIDQVNDARGRLKALTGANPVLPSSSTNEQLPIISQVTESPEDDIDEKEDTLTQAVPPEIMSETPPQNTSPESADSYRHASPFKLEATQNPLSEEAQLLRYAGENKELRRKNNELQQSLTDIMGMLSNPNVETYGKAVSTLVQALLRAQEDSQLNRAALSNLAEAQAELRFATEKMGDVGQAVHQLTELARRTNVQLETAGFSQFPHALPSFESTTGPIPFDEVDDFRNALESGETSAAGSHSPETQKK